jgi:predicted XRE-type DNA-binding protein
MLALAYAIERWIEDGTLASYADAARRLGVSRARITQIVAQVGWAVELQILLLVTAIDTSIPHVRHD